MHKCIICGGVSAEPFTEPYNNNIPAVIPVCFMCASKPNSVRFIIEVMWKRLEVTQEVVTRLVASNIELTKLINDLVSPTGLPQLVKDNLSTIQQEKTL